MLNRLLAGNTAKAAPLCWGDQLQNTTVKILSPRKIVETVVEVGLLFYFITYS